MQCIAIETVVLPHTIANLKWLQENKVKKKNTHQTALFFFSLFVSLFDMQSMKYPKYTHIINHTYTLLFRKKQNRLESYCIICNIFVRKPRKSYVCCFGSFLSLDAEYIVVGCYVCAFFFGCVFFMTFSLRSTTFVIRWWHEISPKSNSNMEMNSCKFIENWDV